MRITGDNKEGKAQLDNFIDREQIPNNRDNVKVINYRC